MSSKARLNSGTPSKWADAVAVTPTDYVSATLSLLVHLSLQLSVHPSKRQHRLHHHRILILVLGMRARNQLPVSVLAESVEEIGVTGSVLDGEPSEAGTEATEGTVKLSGSPASSGVMTVAF